MKRHVLALAIALLAMDAGAQTVTSDPVITAYKEYAAAQKNNDLAGAEAAAGRAWKASEAKDGDGGKTAVLAFNAALARLALNREAAAVEPARRAVALAEKGAAGVDPLQARLVLGEALLAENYAEAKKLLPPTLSAARLTSGDVRAAAYDSAYALGKAAMAKREWEVAREAWSSAFDFADAIPSNVEMARADALIGRGITFAAVRKDAEAMLAFNQALVRLAPLAPEREDDKVTAAEKVYANAYAWSSAVSARIISQESTPASFPLSRIPKKAPASSFPPGGGRPLLPNKPPLCSLEFVSTPQIDYPSSALDGFGVGAAVMRLKIDANGAIASQEVIASIPGPEFGDAIRRVKDTWAVKARAGSPSGCRFETSDVLLAVKFILE